MGSTPALHPLQAGRHSILSRDFTLVQISVPSGPRSTVVDPASLFRAAMLALSAAMGGNMATLGTILVVGGGISPVSPRRQPFIGTASRRNLSSDSRLGRLWGLGSWFSSTVCACCARWVSRRALRMLARLFADGNSVASTATCCRRSISRHCGAMLVPASGSNGASCNERCCRASPMCAARSAHRSFPWSRTIVVSQSGSAMARPEITISLSAQTESGRRYAP